MSVSSQPEIDLGVTANAGVEVKKFMDAEGVTAEQGGLRVSVQPGGCSGFKYSLVIEDRAAEDDLVIPREGFNVFVDPFSAQYLNGVTIDYVTAGRQSPPKEACGRGTMAVHPAGGPRGPTIDRCESSAGRELGSRAGWEFSHSHRTGPTCLDRRLS